MLNSKVSSLVEQNLRIKLDFLKSKRDIMIFLYFLHFYRTLLLLIILNFNIEKNKLNLLIWLAKFRRKFLRDTEIKNDRPLMETFSKEFPFLIIF